MERRLPETYYTAADSNLRSSASNTAGMGLHRPPSISLSDLPTHGRRASTTMVPGSLKATPIVDNFLSMIPMGHEKALKYAFYNVLAMVLSGFLLFMLWGVYCVLNPFLKSLLWAVLVGTVLYPFKKNLSGAARQWLQNVRRSSTPFVVRVVTAPVVMVDSLSDAIGSRVLLWWKSVLAAVVLFLCTYLVYYNPPTTVVRIGHWGTGVVWTLVQWSLRWVVNLPVVIAVNVVYGLHLFSNKQSRLDESVASSHSSASVTESSSSSLLSTPATPDSATAAPEKPQAQMAADSPDSSTEQRICSAATPELTRALPYSALAVTAAYICTNWLPYYILVGLTVFVSLGVVTYVQGHEDSNTGGTGDDAARGPQDPTTAKKVLPSISRYAALMVLNIGSGTPVGSISLSGTPRGSQQGTPKLGVATGATLEERRTRLQKSLSEGSAGGDSEPPSRTMSKEPSEKSIAEMYDEHTQAQSRAQDEGDSTPTPADSTEFVLDSNVFLYSVFVACVVVQVWNHLWVMHLLPLPVVYYGAKRLCVHFGVSTHVQGGIQVPVTGFITRLKEIRPVRVTFDILGSADRRLVSVCEDCLDSACSGLVLVLVGMATVLGTIFLATQVYAEGDHLVRVSMNLVNSTVSQYPEINALLPDGWQSMMSSVVGNAYLYGRETITNMIRDSVGDKQPEKAEQIERQLIELWDKIYETWNHTWDNAFPEHAAKQQLSGIGGKPVDWDELLETGKEMPALLDVSMLTSYAKANVGTLWSILESVWNILIGNVSLVLSAVGSVVSVLFGGGTAILNLIINFVIFLTALFYLLSSSTDVYKPVELFMVLSPSSGTATGAGRTSGFARAVEEAVNGVFAASFKMAAFYGMWTWLIHTLFQVNIVFLPSMFAALFGAIPIVAPYVAALPAVLELWVIQGNWPLALCMFLAQMAPMSMVDTQIYSEIKGGGHPYLTGLAIAGGIFYFGMQGAIWGPVILCCVFVAVKVGSNFMRDEVAAETQATKSRPASEKSNVQ